jgi:hypothetical protein
MFPSDVIEESHTIDLRCKLVVVSLGRSHVLYEESPSVDTELIGKGFWIQ